MRAVGANREVIATDALTVARLADAVLSQQHGQEDHRTVLDITVLIPIGAGNADCYTAARPAVTAPSGSGRVVGREEITSSTIRYSFACSAVMKKSRSVSRWIFSMDWPVWWARMRFSSSRIRRISLAWMSMSVACPCTPPSGWWSMIRAWGRADRLALAPAASRSAPREGG